MKNPGFYLLVMFAIALLISTNACNKVAPTPTPTITPTPTPEPTILPGESTRDVLVNGVERQYSIHIPSGINSLHPVPVVFAFHGNTNTPSDMQVMTRFNPIADQNGFLIIYPWGVDLSWNAGGCCGTALAENIDEAAFVRQMLADLGTIVRVDPKRIYATGFSNGGMLVYRLACEMSDTFAAIAPVSGRLYYNPCQPKQPVSVIHIHGLSDPVVPYLESGIPDVSGFIPPPIEQGIATWAKLDGCTGSPKEEKEGQVTHIFYDSCQAGTTVELYKIEGLGHDYPMTIIFPASQKIWEFFTAHSKP